MSKGIKSTGVIPSNLRAVRAYYNLQAKEVASKMGIHLNTLYFWERGSHEPSGSDLRKLAAIYKMPADMLLRTKLVLSNSITNEVITK